MSNLRRCRAGIIMLAIIVVLAWAFIPAVKLFINHGVAALASLDQQGIEHFIRAWGPQAALVSFVLMILQAIIAPLPAFILTFANASLFGAFWGGLLSWSSAMAGATLCFYLARVLGREAVEKLTGKRVLENMDGFLPATANTPFLFVGYFLLFPSIPLAMPQASPPYAFATSFWQQAWVSFPLPSSTPWWAACSLAEPFGLSRVCLFFLR